MPEGASISIRRHKDGTVHVSGDGFPDRHLFNARHIARELDHPYGSMFDVFVVLRTASHGDVLYRLTGFGELDPDNPGDDRLNLNNWEVERVPDSLAKKFTASLVAAAKKETKSDG